jgi:hypothetical protein
LISVATALATDPLPKLSPQQILDKAVEQTRAALKENRRAAYAYTKHVRTEELDESAQVKETKEKTFWVQSGVGQLRSMLVNGKRVSEEEMEKQNREAIETRKKITGGGSGKTDDWEQFINPDVLSRFNFEVLRQEVFNGRPAYVLGFAPRQGKLPVKKLADRVLNQMTGTLWIDGKDFAVAKADLRLQSKVALGGMLQVIGALKQFRYVMERVRVEEFVWLNRSTYGEYEGRKLWDTTRLRTRSESSGFQKVTPDQTARLSFRTH